MNRNNAAQQGKRFLPLLYYGAAALLLLTLATVSFINTRNQTHSAVRINLAGRQRMLSQKLVKEVLIYRLGGHNRAGIDSTMAVFNVTLHALLDGGRAPADLDSTNFWIIPGAVPGPTRDALDEVHRLWEPFKALVVRYETSGSESDLRAIISSSAEFLPEIEESVVALQRQAQRDNYAASLSLGLLIFVIFGLVSVYLFITIRQLRRATEKIRELETILPLCSNCKMIRTREDPYEQESWITLEEYLYEKDGTEITHGLCPNCAMTLYPEIYAKVLEKRKQRENK
jgi:nitrate/nitrite-specific signal transduction histidine kinase